MVDRHRVFEGEAMPMTENHDLERIATFCGECNCGCPELWVDHGADAERRVVITDDFGQRVQMSLTQLADLVADVKGGVLDGLLAGTR
jgi:hypothetical protein